MTEEAVRNASIVADEDTDLLVIDRDLFNDTLKVKQQKQLTYHRNYYIT